MCEDRPSHSPPVPWQSEGSASRGRPGERLSNRAGTYPKGRLARKLLAIGQCRSACFQQRTFCAWPPPIDLGTRVCVVRLQSARAQNSATESACARLSSPPQVGSMGFSAVDLGERSSRRYASCTPSSSVGCAGVCHGRDPWHRNVDRPPKHPPRGAASLPTSARTVT